MNDVRFFFDECLSRPVVEGQLTDSLRLFGSDAETAHLITKFNATGVKDGVWVPQLVAEQGWIAISADRGAHSKKSEKLPLICKSFGLTHVIISSGIHRRNIYYKVLAIESLWGELLSLADQPAGSGFRLVIKGNGFGLDYVSEPSLPLDEPPKVPPVQQSLLDDD